MHHPLEVPRRQEPPPVPGAEDDAVGRLKEGKPIGDGCTEIDVDPHIAVASHPRYDAAGAGLALCESIMVMRDLSEVTSDLSIYHQICVIICIYKTSLKSGF